MNLIKYILLRLIRRNLPDILINYLMDKNIILKNNISVTNPFEIINSYNELIDENDIELDNKILLELGSGKKLHIAKSFLNKNIKSIILIDPNLEASATDNNRINIIKNVFTKEIIKCSSVDLILSYSFLEHIRDLEDVISNCNVILKDKGKMIHIVDLRDHYFAYPYGMLFFTKRIWNNLLAPKGEFYLNRCRKKDYEEIISKMNFKQYRIFNKFTITIDEFNKIKNKINIDILKRYTEADLRATQLVIYAEK